MDKINSWRFGIAFYFIMQSVIMIIVFKLCTTTSVSEADISMGGKISELVFKGTGLVQYVIIIPAVIIFLITKKRKAALSIFVCSIIWLIVVFGLFNQQQ